MGTSVQGSATGFGFGANAEYETGASPFAFRLSGNFYTGDFDNASDALSIYYFSLLTAEAAVMYRFRDTKFAPYLGIGAGVSAADINMQSGIVFSPGFGPMRIPKNPDKPFHISFITGASLFSRGRVSFFTEAAYRVHFMKYQIEDISAGTRHQMRDASATIGHLIFALGIRVPF